MKSTIMPISFANSFHYDICYCKYFSLLTFCYSFQEELMFLLRKLLLYFRDLPAQMAHSLFNYLVRISFLFSYLLLISHFFIFEVKYVFWYCPLFFSQIGYVIFYVRTPSEGSKEAIAGALSLLWQVKNFTWIPVLIYIVFNLRKLFNVTMKKLKDIPKEILHKEW